MSYIRDSSYSSTDLPSSTRAAVSTMVEANGAAPDDLQVSPFNKWGGDAMDWVDEDDGGISAEGGELNDAVRTAYGHIVLSSVCQFCWIHLFFS